METGPIWKEEEEDHCVSHSGNPPTTVTLTLTHNNSDSRLFIEPARTFFQGGGAWKITLDVDHTYTKWL